MPTLLLRFRQSLTLALSRAGIRWSHFESNRDYERFANAADGISDATHVAALALDHFIEGAMRIGGINYCILLAVLDFLNSVLGIPTEDLDGTLRLRALVEVVPSPVEQYRIWARSWYR
jgi:hypothetical protein